MVIREAISSEDIHQALQLRVKVFVDEQKIPAELDLDGLDDTSIHIIVIVDGQVVGTGRLTPIDRSLAVLARICVHPDYRDRKLGVRIMNKLESVARQQHFQRLHLTPHVYLENFYNRLGYSVISKDAGKVGGHALIKMEKQING